MEIEGARQNRAKQRHKLLPGNSCNSCNVVVSSYRTRTHLGYRIQQENCGHEREDQLNEVVWRDSLGGRFWLFLFRASTYPVGYHTMTRLAVALLYAATAGVAAATAAPGTSLLGRSPSTAIGASAVGLGSNGLGAHSRDALPIVQGWRRLSLRSRKEDSAESIAKELR